MHIMWPMYARMLRMLQACMILLPSHNHYTKEPENYFAFMEDNKTDWNAGQLKILAASIALKVRP